MSVYLPRLRQIREAQGLTRERLSELSGYSMAVIRRIERCDPATARVRERTAAELAVALGVKMDKLVGKRLPTPSKTHKKMWDTISNYRRKT